MVRRTRTGVHRPREFEINIEPSIREQIKADIKRFPRGTGGFAKFFHMIEMCYRQANGSKPIHADPKSTDCFVNPKIFSNVELTVIGHSMGTIVINELLPLFRELPVKDIVYMASAASVRDSKRSLAPLLSHQDNSKHSQKFYNLMLHPMNDAQELAVKGMAPSGSLLAWIDEMYENPRTMLDRTFGKWRNVRATKHIFRPESQKNMIFRVYNWRGPSAAYLRKKNNHCYPVTHGGFNDDRMAFWRPQFWGADRVGWRSPIVGNETLETKIKRCLN